jgi:branched-chain amino acid aminotransferase
MIVFLNGKFVPEDRAVVSVFDRSFLYGDGLFETILVANGALFRWSDHCTRLDHGARFLGISPPFKPAEMRDFAQRLIRENRLPNALLRLNLSRGVGLRGYSPRGADAPFLVMSLHPWPALDYNALTRWHVRTSSVRLPANESLAQFKNCNKLPQVVARAQAEVAGAEEALLLNTDGFVVEGATSNLFWIEQETVCTPPLASGILSGVTRSVVLELCRDLKIVVRECNITSRGLAESDGVFLSLSSVGIVEGASLDGQPLHQSPLTGQIHRSYCDLVRHETAAPSPSEVMH